MARESTQHKLDRVRSPRVQITYDVEVGDAIELKELPFVMGVLGDRGLLSGGILGVMAGKAELIAARDQVGGILVAVHVMAIETSQFAMVHVALDKIVTLHPVLVGRKVGELVEVGNAGAQIFKLPEVGEPLPGKVANWPIVVLLV